MRKTLAITAASTLIVLAPVTAASADVTASVGVTQSENATTDDGGDKTGLWGLLGLLGLAGLAKRKVKDDTTHR